MEKAETEEDEKTGGPGLAAITLLAVDLHQLDQKRDGRQDEQAL